MDESRLEDHVVVLTISEAQQEREKTETDPEIGQSLLANDYMDTIKPARTEASQVSDGTDKEKLLTTRKFLSDQQSDPYCRKFQYCRQAGICISL